MGSSSSEQVQDTTNNLAVDRRVVQEEGTQVLGNVTFDQSNTAIAEYMQGLTAQWEVMVSNNKLNLLEVSRMGGKLLDLVDTSQVKMSDLAYSTLKNGLRQFDAMIRQGDMVLEFAEDVSTKALDVTSDTTAGAFDLVAEVKTGNFSESLQNLTIIMAAFALGAIYLATKE